MADAVAAGAPQHSIAIDAEEVAGGLKVAPVAQLECGVEVAVRAGADQVDRVMIDPAAQEREEVAHPIRYAEAQHVDIELRDGLNVSAVKRDVAKLVRDNAVSLEF